MTTSFVPVNPVDVSPAVGAWVDVDVSAYVPAGATGVILHIVQKTGTNRIVGLRKKGSTDAVIKSIYVTQHLWAMVGVDAARIFQVYTSGVSQDNTFWLVGYTLAGVAFLTNMVELAVPWHYFNPVFETIDVSAICPGAVAVILEMWTDANSPSNDSLTSPSTRSHGFRKTGSSDTYVNVGCYHHWAIIGCDSGQHIDIWHTGHAPALPTVSWRHTAVVGYVTAGATFFTNGIKKTPDGAGWKTVDCSGDVGADPAKILFFEIRHGQSTVYNYGVRKNGSAENIYRWTGANHNFAFVECDTGQVVQFQKGYSGTGDAPGLYLLGYATLIAPPVGLPTVTTDPANNILAGSAQLNGTLNNDGGEVCDCGFEWGLTAAYGHTTPTSAQSTGDTFAQVVAGLTPGTLYHFRAFATNSAGTAYGADANFTTLAAPIVAPTVTTNDATVRQQRTVRLNGTLVDNGGDDCDCGFQWGLTPAYGQTTLTTVQTTGENFSRLLSALEPGTHYHYRAFATNSAGTSFGADVLFDTEAIISQSYALGRWGL